MKPIENVKDVIWCLGGLTKVGRRLGCSVPTVQKWSASNRLPAQHWGAVIRFAHERQFDEITAELLVKIHEPVKAQSDGSNE